MNAKKDHSFSNATEYPLLQRLHPLRKDPSTPEHYFQELEENIHCKKSHPRIRQPFKGMGREWFLWTGIAATLAILIYWAIPSRDVSPLASIVPYENTAVSPAVAPILSEKESEPIVHDDNASKEIWNKELKIQTAPTAPTDTLWELFSAEELEIYLIENDEF